MTGYVDPNSKDPSLGNTKNKIGYMESINGFLVAILGNTENIIELIESMNGFISNHIGNTEDIARLIESMTGFKLIKSVMNLQIYIIGFGEPIIGFIESFNEFLKSTFG